MRNFLIQLPARTARVLTVYRLPILSGLLIGTSYIPFPPWALFFCLTPLFLFWVQSAKSFRQVFFAGWLTQFILNLIGFHWIAYTAIEFGHFPIIGGLLSLVGFASIAHLYYPVGGVIAYWLAKRFNLGATSQLIASGLAFGLCELCFSSIFPWHLGYPWLWAGFPGAQFADVIGFEGLNLLTITCNVLMTLAVMTGLFRAPKERAWKFVAATLAIIALTNLAGLGRAEPWRKTDRELKVLAVQGNIGNFDKYMAELHSAFGIPIVQKYLSLTREGLALHPDAQLIIWPETAFPGYLDQPSMGGMLQSQVRNLLLEKRVPLLSGAYSRRNPTSQDTYNGVFFLNADGFQPVQPYHKTILLVFGETFPFSDYIPYMDKFFPEQGSFAKGSGPTVWPLMIDTKLKTYAKLGPMICYEGLYPWFAAQMSKKGAEIFVNVTNDSWFWKPFEPNQHMYMTMARAIEFRRPLVRATNTGITSAMTAAGDFLQKSPIGLEWTDELKVPYIADPPHTFYERLDAAWAWILILGLVLTLALGRGSGVALSGGSKTEPAHSP